MAHSNCCRVRVCVVLFLLLDRMCVCMHVQVPWLIESFVVLEKGVSSRSTKLAIIGQEKTMMSSNYLQLLTGAALTRNSHPLQQPLDYAPVTPATSCKRNKACTCATLKTAYKTSQDEQIVLFSLDSEFSSSNR